MACPLLYVGQRGYEGWFAMMNQTIPAPKEINVQGRTKEVSELFPFSGKAIMGSLRKNVHSDNREPDPFLPMLKEGLRALNMVDETAPAISGTEISLKMENSGAVKGGKITEGEPAIIIKGQMSGAENAIVSQESDISQGKFFRIPLLPGLPMKENSQDGPFVTIKDDDIKTDEWQIRNKEEIVLPLSPDKNQLATLIRIISDALKKHGFEDDRIGEILSEIKDKGLFTVKEGSKPVLPPGKSISEYGAEAGMKPGKQEEQASTIRIISDALKKHGFEDDGIGEILSEIPEIPEIPEIKDKGLFTAKEGSKPVLPPGKSISEYDAKALGVERATNAVYEMPEAGMKPVRQEEQASTGRTSFSAKGDLLSIGGDKNISVIRAGADAPGNDHPYDRKLPGSLVFEKAASAREYDGPMAVSAYGGGAAVNKASNAPHIDGRFLVNQIANQLSDESGKGFGRVKITLSPQHLGNLDMDIIVRENKVHVVMTAEHHDVRQALQGHADQLKSALQQQGLQVHSMDFLLQGGHHGRDGGLGGGNLWWREENRKSENRNERAGKPSLAEIASPASAQNDRQGVYGISVFV